MNYRSKFYPGHKETQKAAREPRVGNLTSRSQFTRNGNSFHHEMQPGVNCDTNVVFFLQKYPSIIYPSIHLPLSLSIF